MAEGSVKRLVGWKELAGYLGTSPRTVQRWEQEKGLPVRRVPGSSGHSVFADPAELDRWLESKGSGVTLAADQNLAGVNPGRTWRRPAMRMAAATGVAIVIVVLWVGLVHAAKEHKSSVRAIEPATRMPAINCVSGIEPKADQVIVIKGQGFGVHTYYADEDTAFIAIRDKTARWAAGRIIPQNWDEVTLNVASWTDSEIVVTGFAGAYGQHWWKLTAGDQIEVAIWNPQTQAGPATYQLAVDSRQLARK